MYKEIVASIANFNKWKVCVEPDNIRKFKQLFKCLPVQGSIDTTCTADDTLYVVGSI